ncbi:MAG: hypothetical protein HBSAPP03_06960 [Phycisphaerae bacterium]|nr:MAG: hypothetical protein HBSAPP03_06960 [Phycisphaerae bacterium]
MSVGLLMALPSGLIVSGVARWAVRLANGLVREGRRAGLILHAPAGAYRPLRMEVDARVVVTDLTHLPPIESCGGEVGVYLTGYREAVGAMARAGAVVLSPNLVGDCYAAAARAMLERPGDTRLVGWLHSDTAYEYHVPRHFEAAVSRFVAVSGAIETKARACLPGREADVTRIGYGVESPARLPERATLKGRAVRVVYAGRMERWQKRVLALPAMSRSLTARGVSHEVVILGDGPAGAELRRACAGLREVVVLGPQEPERVAGVLARADIAVLGSRYEGLPIAVLEAMAQGCVPVVTRTASGAAEVIEDGVSGVIVEVGEEASEADVGAALAAGVERAMAQVESMREAAWARVREAYSVEGHARAVARMMDEVAAKPARAWPSGRACAFSGAGGGSVPAEGWDRVRAVSAALEGKRVVVHGTGRHTRELVAPALEAGLLAGVVAFTDDDPAAWGGEVAGRPVVRPEEAGSTGATEVVVSSWIHQGAIMARRGMYERQGLAVHALYAEESAGR